MKAAGLIMLVALVLVIPSAAADSFTLTVAAQTSTTITFTYPQQTGYGYLYSADGTIVSRTNDPTKTQIKFAKASSYEVAAIVKGTTGSYPTAPPPPPPPKPACSDGADNDGDGKIDYPADPGCASATDTDETDTVTQPTTISSSQCASRASVTGAVIDNVTVTGGCTVTAQNVTIQNSTLSDMVNIRPSATGMHLLNSKSRGFELKGADNVVVQGNVFDGQLRTDNIEIYDEPDGNTPDGWVLRNNTFKNFYVNDGSTHSEALFIGYSRNGLIEGNTFTNNGNTSHIFFTWWGGARDPATSYPRNVCVRGNTFTDNQHHFYAVNFRAEIPTSSGIKTDPNEPGFSTTSPKFNGTC